MPMRTIPTPPVVAAKNVPLPEIMRPSWPGSRSTQAPRKKRPTSACAMTKLVVPAPKSSSTGEVMSTAPPTAPRTCPNVLMFMAWIPLRALGPPLGFNGALGEEGPEDHEGEEGDEVLDRRSALGEGVEVARHREVVEHRASRALHPAGLP